MIQKNSKASEKNSGARWFNPWPCYSVVRVTLQFPSWRLLGCWTKNRGRKTPQNGWWKSWFKTLWTNGWFGGVSHYFWKHPLSIWKGHLTIPKRVRLNHLVDTYSPNHLVDIHWALSLSPPKQWVMIQKKTALGNKKKQPWIESG